MPNRTITQHDKDIARNLRDIWNKKRRDLELTQQAVARQMGISQPSFSQYLNCVIAPNTDFVLEISKILKVDPAEIDPAIKNRLHVVTDKPIEVSMPVLFSLSGDLPRGETQIMVTLVETGSTESRSYYAVLCDTDSGTIREGSHLIVDPNAELEERDKAFVTFRDGSRRAMVLHKVTSRSYHLRDLSSAIPEVVTTPISSIYSIHKIVSVQFP